jgi:predicted RND superfamily exporter protein
LIAVLTAGPLLAGWTPLGRSSPANFRSTAKMLQSLMRTTKNHATGISFASGVFLLLGIASLAWLRPDFRYREFLPLDSATLSGLTEVESAFGGSYPLRVAVDWPPEATDHDVLRLLEQVEQTLAENPIVNAPWSVLAPIRAIAGAQTPVVNLPSPNVVPLSERSRLWLPEFRRALVETRAPDIGAAQLEPHLAALETSLDRINQEHPGFSVRLSGLHPVSARTSLAMIDSLARSLAIAAVLIVATLAIAMRSARMGVVSVIPNLLPLSAICLFLAASGRPLQFTTVTVLTLVLALAVDDSIHLLAGFRRARKAGADTETAIMKTIGSVGDSLVITTALLVAGFGAVGLSKAPMMSLFGWLAAGALILALLADLIALPALLRIAYPNRTPSGGSSTK